MEKIEVMIVMEDESKAAEIINMLTNIDYIKLMTNISPGEDLVTRLLAAQPDVILLGSETGGDGYKVLEQLLEENPGTISIMIEDELKEENVRKAIFSGAKDVLVYPFASPLLLDSIYRCYQKEKKKKLQQRSSSPEAKRSKKVDGNIITVYSNKGGVGKTFVAVNLASSLALKTDMRVALVDLDLDYGNAALALNLIPHFTISDVINDIRNLDRDLMESYMIPHSSGLMVLASPSQARLNEFINEDHISAILKTLKSSFDYIIVDMPTRLIDILEPVFFESDQLLLVLDQNLATIQNMKSFIVELESLNFPKAKVKLLLNSFDRRREITQKDVEVTLKMKVGASIPYDYRSVPSSLNRGIPVNLFNPRSKVAKSIDQLSSSMKDEELGKGQKSNEDKKKLKEEQRR